MSGENLSELPVPRHLFSTGGYGDIRNFPKTTATEAWNEHNTVSIPIIGSRDEWEGNDVDHAEEQLTKSHSIGVRYPEGLGQSRGNKMLPVDAIVERTTRGTFFTEEVSETDVIVAEGTMYLSANGFFEAIRNRSLTTAIVVPATRVRAIVCLDWHAKA